MKYVERNDRTSVYCLSQTIIKNLSCQSDVLLCLDTENRASFRNNISYCDKCQKPKCI